jgi:hypothetical protein
MQNINLITNKNDIYSNFNVLLKKYNKLLDILIKKTGDLAQCGGDMAKCYRFIFVAGFPGKKGVELREIRGDTVPSSVAVTAIHYVVSCVAASCPEVHGHVGRP